MRGDGGVMATLENIERLALVGCGKMGSAMLQGWLALGLPPQNVAVLEPQPSDDVTVLVKRGLALNPDLSKAGKFSVVVLALAVLNELDLFLWLVAIGSHVFWIVLLCLQRLGRRALRAGVPTAAGVRNGDP